MSLFRLHMRRKAEAAREDARKAAGDAGVAMEHVHHAYGVRMLFAGLLWGSVYLLSRGLLALEISERTLRVAIAVLPVPFFVWFLWTWMKNVRSMDELERRIELEALSLAFPLAVVLLMTLGLLEIAMPLDPADWSYRHVWAMMPLLYYIGLWRANRRYQ
jgi:hypothetical protein